MFSPCTWPWQSTNRCCAPPLRTWQVLLGLQCFAGACFCHLPCKRMFSLLHLFSRCCGLVWRQCCYSLVRHVCDHQGHGSACEVCLSMACMVCVGAAAVANGSARRRGDGAAGHHALLCHVATARGPWRARLMRWMGRCKGRAMWGAQA